jgi:Starch-binding associating with outer membrane
MKNLKKLYKILMVLPAFLVLGCDDFLDVNQNKNNPTSGPPSVLLPTGLIGTAFANANELNRFASTVMDYTYGAVGNPAAYDAYNIDGGNFGNQWRFEIYAGAIVSYNEVIKSATAVGGNSYIGIAKIMKAYTFSIATDVWGDVPYSQAGQGEVFLQPRLDSQEDIYKGNASLGIQSLFDLIREGLADLDKVSTANPDADDVVYDGDLAKWKRAGYTLMLKLALQISNREPALATSIINEVLTANNYINTNAANLSVKFGASTGSQSPIYTWTNISFQNEMIVSTGFE